MWGALDIDYLPQRSVKVWLNQRPSYLVLTENNCQCSSSRSCLASPTDFMPALFLPFQGLGPNSHPIHWASASQQEIWVVANCKSQPATDIIYGTQSNGLQILRIGLQGHDTNFATAPQWLQPWWLMQSPSKLEFLSSELLNTKPFSPCCTSLSRSTHPSKLSLMILKSLFKGQALARQQRISRKPVNQLQTYPPPHYPKVCCIWLWRYFTISPSLEGHPLMRKCGDLSEGT